MVSKDQDLVKHGTNLPNYLLCEGKGGNIQEKAYSFGVLDWSRIEKWKSNAKIIVKTKNLAHGSGEARLSTPVNNNIHLSDQQASNGHYSSLSKKFSFSIEKISKSLIFKASSKCKQLKSEVISYKSSLDLQKFNLRVGPAYDKTVTYEKKQCSSNMKALLKLTMKNGIPSFKLVVDNSTNILTAAVEKLPSGKDDTSLTYTFYSVLDVTNKNGVCRKLDSTETDSRFGYNVVGNMKISTSYHAEFSGLERDLFVVRESVLYGLDFTRSDCKETVELAAVIVKNSSKESYEGLGSSKSTVVILPGGSHSLPSDGQPSPLTDRWRSGGLCDCGGWDIGCELKILTNQNEMSEISNPSTSNPLDLCYQGRHDKKHAFSLAQLENGFYSLEYNASSMSSLQAFSICVAVISSQDLTHIFQVNYVQDANDLIRPIITRHRKVKSQTNVTRLTG